MKNTMSNVIEKLVLASLDKILLPTLDKALDASEKMADVYDQIKKLSDDLEKVAGTLVSLSSAVYMHQQAINDLYASQKQILGMLKTSKSSSVDIAPPKKPEEKKPN